MTVHAPTTSNSIKKSLVALKMARALEVLDVSLRRIKQGEIDAIAALDQLVLKQRTFVRAYLETANAATACARLRAQANGCASSRDLSKKQMAIGKCDTC
jgi:hypothetical protein